MNKCTCLIATLVLASTVAAQPIVVMDGSADDVLYGPPVATQNTETGFGDSNLGRPDLANGSELNQVYGFVHDDGAEKWLCLVLSGNLESNGNRLDIFFDSVAGGQNRLLATNPGTPGEKLLRMAELPDDPNFPGLTFSAGFEADYWVAANVFGSDPTSVFLDYARLWISESDPGVLYFCGSGLTKCETLGGALTGGDDGCPTLYCTIDNRNVDGVPGGDSFAFPEEVRTGIELAIPLSALGDPTGDIKITAFVNGQQHNFISNQLLGGLFGSTNLGEPRQVDLSTTAHAPFSISATPIDPVGACCVGTSCSLTTQINCGGVWLGANTNCDGNPCDAVPSGACCFDDDYSGVCEIHTAIDCVARDGDYQGDGTTCAGCPCLLPPSGACCDGETCTEDIREEDCLAAAGDYVGDFTNCDDSPCEAGACCDVTDCTDVRSFECEGDRFFGGVMCADGPCDDPTILTPHVAGGMQGWDPTSTPMTETSPGSNIWTHAFTGLDPDTRFTFKITNGFDGEDPDHRSVPSADSWCFSDATGNLLITYDGNFYSDGWSPDRDRLPLPDYSDPGTWVAAGDFQSEVGGDDWDNASAVTVMTPTGTPGIYRYENTGLPAGPWLWKAVISGSWDSISWDARSVNTGDMEFVIGAETDTFALYVDALTGVVRVEITPGGPELCAGDLNCDGIVDFDDIDPFVAALGCQGGDPNCWDPNCPWLNGDTNDDGSVDFDDIDPFVARIGATCP